MKKIVTGAISILMATVLTGCSTFVSNDATTYQLASKLEAAEVIDYYAKALEYDAIISRNITVHETSYVTREITGEKAETLRALVDKAQQILACDEYPMEEENLDVVSLDTYGYIKGIIDNEQLYNGVIKSITGALGYYFVDVEYDVKSSNIGAYKQTANLVGLNGALYEDPITGIWYINTAYMQIIVNKMNKYFRDNLIFKEMKFDMDTCVLSIEEGHLPEEGVTVYETDKELYPEEEDLEAEDNEESELGEGDTENEDETAEITDEDANNEEVTADETSEETVDETAEETADAWGINEADTDMIETNNDDGMISAGTSVTVINTVTAEDRKIAIDINKINEVVGGALDYLSEMPPLDTVYELAEHDDGVISGYGMNNAGGGGLKVFGFDRSALTGKTTLRYVFKDDATGSGKVLGKNIYMIDEEITTGINSASNNILVPDFLMSQFEQLLERADRLQVDYDLASLMAGNVYEDMGQGLLRGYKDTSTNVLKHMSTIRQIINRDTANNAYVVEVESTVIEGARDVDSYGTYRDKSYVVIQQQGTQFKIIDWCRVSRDVINEAPIDPDSATIKRLVALNLAGEVSDNSKGAILNLMSDLYTAGTARIMRGPKDVTSNGETVTIERGMYDCFQNDTTILSEDKLEYMNSTLRTELVRKGTDVGAVYSGTVTEWIGGYEDQVELTTEELIIYNGTGTAYYMQVYYLVSNLNDVWVIDERTVLDEYEVNDQSLIDNIRQRVGL